MKVTRRTTLGDIIQNYSNAKKVLLEYNMHCISCPFSRGETIEEAGSIHGLDISLLVKELNKKLKPKKDTKKK